MKKTELSRLETSELVRRYVSTAVRHWNTGKMYDEEGRPDVKNYNRTADEVGALYLALKARGELAKLMPLIEHDNIGVRVVAASHCLPLAPDRLIPMFEEWERSKDQQVRVEAGWTLDLWRRSNKGEPQ